MITVLIVTYNSAKTIGKTLKSLDGGSASDVRVLIYDNNSCDETLRVVQNFPSVELVVGPENVGYAKAVNTASRLLRGDDDVLLLNPDAVITINDLRKLGRTLRFNSQYGALGPVVMHPEGTTRTTQAGRRPTLWRMFLHFTGIAQIFGSRYSLLEGHYFYQDHLKGRTEIVEADWISGACVLIRRRAWDTCGTLDETWFMYGEDIEYMRRLQEAHWSIGLVPHIQAEHSIGHSAKSSGSEISSLWVINLFEYYARDISRTFFSTQLWRIVVSVGLLSRSGLFGVWHLMGKTSSPHWNNEARMFLSHAFRLMGHHVANTRLH